MANQATGEQGFLANLGKVYGIYTGGFLAFIILVAILEQLGVPNRVLGYLFVGFTILVYAIIGVLSRTAQVSEYYVAGRKVPAFYNGMATGADWMSAASFVGMAGSLYALGYDGLAFVLGWTGGYVLVSVLLAPFLRKFGAYTVPDFLAARYGGNLARFLGVIVLICCSFTYVVAQIYGTGIIASRFLGLDFTIAVYAGLGGHPCLFHAGRHARRDLDPGCAVYRAHRCLPHACRHPVHPEIRRSGSGAHVWPGPAGHHGARTGNDRERTCRGRHAQAARHGLPQL